MPSPLDYYRRYILPSAFIRGFGAEQLEEEVLGLGVEVEKLSEAEVVDGERPRVHEAFGIHKVVLFVTKANASRATTCGHTSAASSNICMFMRWHFASGWDIYRPSGGYS